MRKVLLFFVFLIMATFSSSSFASSGDIQFGIKEVTVLNDKNILVLFNKPLAKEPVEFKIYNSLGEILPIINIDFPKFEAENNEALVTVSGKLEKSSVYKVLVTSALSSYGDRLNQSDIRDAFTFKTGDQIPSSSSGQTSGSIDLNALFRESLNSSNSSPIGKDVSSTTPNSVGGVDTRESMETKKDLKSSNIKQSESSSSSSSNSMVLQNNKSKQVISKEKGFKAPNKLDSGGGEKESLPKAGPEVSYILLSSLLLVLLYFILLTFRKNETKK